MLVERREFHCRACGHIEGIGKEEPPKICPACGIDEFGKSNFQTKYCEEGRVK